jgi:septum formation protein
MDMLGIAYDTCPSRIDEKAIRAADPSTLTKKLAEAKAWKVAEQCADALIVAGDAVAAKDGRIFEKARDIREAAQFLRELSGSTFQFVTSIAVLRIGTGKIQSVAESSDITFRALLDHEIQDYIGKYDVLSYAGAFESDAVLLFAEKISGSYNFVTAFPMSRLIVMLREEGVEI